MPDHGRSRASAVEQRAGVLERRFPLFACLVLTLALAIRIGTLAEDDFWIDEVDTLINAAGRRVQSLAIPENQILAETPPDFTRMTRDSTWSAVLLATRHETHPPLDFLLLNLWRRFVPDNEVTNRLPAAVYSSLTVLPLTLLVRRFAGTGAGLFAGTLLALAHGQILIGQQVRQYALATLWVTLSWWLLVRLVDPATNPNRRRLWTLPAYGLTLLAAVLTHYFTVLFLLGQPLYVLLVRRKIVATLSTMAAAAVIFALLWGPSFLAQQSVISAQSWVHESGPDHLRRTLIRFADLPYRLLLPHALRDFDDAIQVITGTLFGLLLATVAALAVSGRAWRPKAAVLLWTGPPWLALLLLDLLTDRQLLEHIRFAVFLLPGLIAGIACTIATWAGRTPWAGLLAGAALLAIVGLTMKLPATENPAAQAAALTIERYGHSGQLTVFDGRGWLPRHARRLFLLVRRYHAPEGPVALLSGFDDTPVPAATCDFAELLVITPRVTDNPNPCADSHALTGKSPYWYGMGWVFRFQRAASPRDELLIPAVK